ncbi:MAG TPA: SDR family oxidoreductase, partial [Streptosporangiaceae bacterium]
GAGAPRPGRGSIPLPALTGAAAPVSAPARERRPQQEEHPRKDSPHGKLDGKVAFTTGPPAARAAVTRSGSPRRARSPHPAQELDDQTWQDMIDINLTGVWHAAKAAIPHLKAGGRGGAIVLTSSAAGLKAYANIAHYVSAKHGVVGLMKTLAVELAPDFIRVNSIHPTQVDTPMIQNEATWRLFRPDLDHPARADFEPASQAMNLLPIPWVEPADISNALLFLASDEARYITGVPLPVDAGCLIK